MWLDCFCLDGLSNCSELHLTFGFLPFMHFGGLDFEWGQSTSDRHLIETGKNHNKYESGKKLHCLQSPKQACCD